MINKKLTQLKLLLSTEKQIDKIVDYFFDNFPQDADFVYEGQLIQTDLDLEKILIVTLNKHYGAHAKYYLINLHIISVSAYYLLHGSFQFKDRSGIFFYVKDVKQGLVVLTNTGQQTDYFKLTDTTATKLSKTFQM